LVLLILLAGLIKRLMSSCDKLTTRKVVRFQKWRGGNGQVWWDLLIIQLEVVQPKVEPILGFTFFVLGQGSSFKQQATSSLTK